MKKYATIIIVLLLCCFMGTCVYFVAGVSAVSPPIRTYDYSGNISSLERNVKKMAASDPNIVVKSIDTTGDEHRGYAYYITFTFKSTDGNIEYNIVYTKTNNWFKKDKTILKLVEALNLSNNTGGYISGADGLSPLIDLFEKNILRKL